MVIVTTSYQPKRAPRKKRKKPAIVSAIVTPAPLRLLKGPVIRLGKTGDGEGQVSRNDQPARSAIVKPKRKRAWVGAAPDLTEEERQRRREAAGEMWRELVRRAAGQR